MLRNADEKTVERITSEFPQAEKDHKDKMYARVQERMTGSGNVYTDEVRGVEKYSGRHLWRLVPTAVMSVVLIGGAVGGGVMMLKNSAGTTPSAQITSEIAPAAAAEAAENTAEAAATEAATEAQAAQNDAQSGITKDLIFSICENGSTKNFDRISCSYDVVYYEDTGYRSEHSVQIMSDRSQNILTKYSDLGYYRNDGSTVYTDKTTEYFCNGTRAGITVFNSPDTDDAANNRKDFFSVETPELNYLIDDASARGRDLLENFDDWEIVGTEDYLGRKCAVIKGASEISMAWEGGEEDISPDTAGYSGGNSDVCPCEFTITIDVETGVWMKSDIKHTDYDLEHIVSTVTDIAYGEAAKAPLTADGFRQLVLDGCTKLVFNADGADTTIEPVCEADLAFLD